MNMKKTCVLCAAFALIGAITIHAQQGAARGGGPRSPTAVRITPIERGVVKGQPYSAEISTESIQTLADGNRIVQRTAGRVYRDREGRVRREEDRPSGDPTVSIADPVAGTTLTLDPATRTARATPTLRVFGIEQLFDALTVQLTDRQAAKIVKPAFATGVQSPAEVLPRPLEVAGRGGRGGGNHVEEKLTDRMIEGVLASGVRRTTTIEKGAIGNEQPIKIVSEEWTSPDLQVLVLTDLTDPRTGRSTYRLLKITRYDPDPALFQVPPDYTVQPGRGAVPATSVPGAGGGGRGRVGRSGGAR